jgi:hypothetical protein
LKINVGEKFMKKNLAGWAPGTASVIAVLMVASMAAHNVMAQGGGIQIERSFPAIESGDRAALA